MMQHPVAPSAAVSEASETSSDASASSLATLRICVVGLGYVGLPTALLFARKGFAVQGVDIDPAVRAMIETDAIAERYPELAPWAQAARDQTMLRGAPAFTIGQTPEPADVFIITVPTPVHPESRRCDLRAVRAAARSIAPALRPGCLVMLESTVPPGTTRNVVRPILSAPA